MFSKVNVVLAEKDSAQVIPTQAVVSRNDVEGVFQITRGETVAHYVPVQVGIRTLDKTEIVSPALDGMVVTLGQHLLEDGSNVILPH